MVEPITDGYVDYRGEENVLIGRFVDAELDGQNIVWLKVEVDLNPNTSRYSAGQLELVLVDEDGNVVRDAGGDHYGAQDTTNRVQNFKVNPLGPPTTHIFEDVKFTPGAKSRRIQLVFNGVPLVAATLDQIKELAEGKDEVSRKEYEQLKSRVGKLEAHLDVQDENIERNSSDIRHLEDEVRRKVQNGDTASILTKIYLKLFG